MNPTAHYPLAEGDFATARAYVQRKISRQPHWLDHRQAETEWWQAKNDPQRFQHWCERWLDADQWRRLQRAVRAARKRRRTPLAGHTSPVVTVALSRTAWHIVSSLADQDGMPLSEWLIRRHQNEWRRR